MAGEIRIDGMKELQRKIDEIQKETSVDFTNKSLRAALKPMTDDAISSAPLGDKAHRSSKGRMLAPGFLKRNIKLKKIKGKNAGYTLAARGDAFYGRIIELGFRSRTSDPWLGEAYEDTKDQVMNNFLVEVSKRLVRASKRIRTKYK